MKILRSAGNQELDEEVAAEAAAGRSQEDEVETSAAVAGIEVAVETQVVVADTWKDYVEVG